VKKIKMKKQFHVFILLVFLTNVVSAQDPSFTQFFASPLTLNPALTGKFDGDLRVAGNYRNQWPTVNNAYITSTVSIDFPILQSQLAQDDRWGLGFMAMTDKTANGILTSNYVALSTAYHKTVDENGLHSVSVGFQGTYANRILDGPRLHFLDGLQIDGTWLPSSSEPVNLQVVTASYFNMNAGVLYNGSLNGDNAVYLGVAMYNINQPHASFLGANDITIPSRLTIHGGGYFPSAGSGQTWYLSALYNRQATASEFVVGGALELSASTDETKPVNVYFGSWMRLSNVNDALIPYVGMDYGSFNLGITYDVNVSAFKVASQTQGGIEISLVYIFKKQQDDGRNKVKCPHF
jgi:type IX secretion system PorP/SprF family membrane protein